MRGQGAFEYVLLLAGVLLIVVLAVVLLRGGLFIPAQQGAQVGNCVNVITGLTGYASVWQGNSTSNSGCYASGGVWNSTGLILNTTFSAACQAAFQGEPGTSHLTQGADVCSGSLNCPDPGSYGYKCGPVPQ